MISVLISIPGSSKAYYEFFKRRFLISMKDLTVQWDNNKADKILILNK